ncbi:hypothetical protein [Halorubellus sp. PRR65]|uniref:hypothetical protein n=1 Tax=Halorubellus sp. PRR65 TaxID=3098148 RepID=UPI002B25AFBE|nr:hypothetical protein [Halorubellus sp. PRR65]
MRRRALLATVAASVTAGCGAFGGAERRGRGTFGVENPPTGTGTQRALRPVPYSQFEGTTASLPAADRVVAFSPAEVGSSSSLVLRVGFERDATESRPATLRATLRNRSEEQVTVETSGVPAFEPEPAYRPDAGDAGVDGETSEGADAPGERGRFALAPTPDHPFSLSTPAVARSGDGSWTVSSVDAWLPDEVTIDAWGNATGRYALVGVDPDRDADATTTTGSDAGAATTDETGRGLAIGTGRYRLGDGALATTAFVWRRSTPGPTVPANVDGAGRPPLSSVERWYHDATPRSKSWLAPARRRVQLPATLSFELVNHTESNLTGRRDQWRLHRLADGSWHPLSWRDRADISEPILPGERVSWTLRLAHDDTTPAGAGIPVDFLGGGTYAFASAYEDGFAAAFEVDAPSLSLRPTAGVTVERDDDAVVVSDRCLDDAAALVFERRAVDATPSPTLVAEQAYRDRVLRNTLTFADEAAVVRYRTATTPERGPFRWGDGPFRFTYEGQGSTVELVDDATDGSRRPRRGR